LYSAIKSEDTEAVDKKDKKGDTISYRTGWHQH